jgi:hypothetical protein
MKSSAFLAPLTLLFGILFLHAETEPGRVLEPGKKPDDIRLTTIRTLNDKDFNLVVPATREAWEARKQAVREQVLVANGLWPMPEKTPLKPVIHGKIEREGYTIEKVYFASLPGHYVTGNLYRPTDRKGPLAGVLCPHGHWREGRFYDAGEAEAKKQMDGKGEKTMAGAHHPLQARCAQLARMGCVVFHYDMVGYADSFAIPHRQGFLDAEAELRLQSFMGLQTWNSIRSLDFLLSLPDVDPKRIGVTGASGGGTQTFLLCGIDDRPAVAFPAVMVSTAMQGGCICENCSYLRVGTGNIELAGLFAPKPLAMSGANDWTVDIERKGLPELKELYRLLGAEENVMGKCFPEFGHNYNQVSREMMYGWFNKHLRLGLPEPVKEQSFEPVPPRELSVFDQEHARPKDALDAAGVRKFMTDSSERQIAALKPTDAKSLAEYRRVIGTALRVLVDGGLPATAEVEATLVGEKEKTDGFVLRRMLLARKGQEEQVPALGIRGEAFDGTVVVWIHPEGKKSLWAEGKLSPAARQILDRKAAILAVDVFGVGELTPDKPVAVDKTFSGYTFGYNRPLLAQQVHDILTAVAYARGHDRAKVVHLVGWGKAGPSVMLARGLCGDAVARTAADADGFRFAAVKEAGDERMLPGGLKYGGLQAFAGLAAPAELSVFGLATEDKDAWLEPVYKAAGAADKLEMLTEGKPADKVAAWLLR